MHWSPTSPINGRLRHRRPRRALSFYLAWVGMLALSAGLWIAAGYGLTAVAVHLTGR
jgi:hypothetical protein